ncbi:MAG: Arginine-tRNA ligase, partial [candidate division WWE3 bacterium GW2011_GWC2_44_9]
MQDVAKIIKLGVASALRSLYKIDNADVSLEHPQNPKWGDYSTNSALVYAKKLGKDPMEVAKDVSALLFKSALYVEDFGKELLLFSDVSVAHPGFINFRLSRELLFCSMLCVLKEGSKFGSQNIGLGKRVALEHSNVNPNKSAHVGHLRNAVIGQFIERAYEYLGYDVQVQYYSNDLGLQVTTSLLGMQVLGTSIDASKYKKFDHYAWDVYSKFSSMLDVDPKLKSRLEELMLKLETGDTAVTKEQTELSGRILKDNLCTFAALGIDYDLIVYESSIKQFGMWEKAFERFASMVNDKNKIDIYPMAYLSCMLNNKIAVPESSNPTAIKVSQVKTAKNIKPILSNLNARHQKLYLDAFGINIDDYKLAIVKNKYRALGLERERVYYVAKNQGGQITGFAFCDISSKGINFSNIFDHFQIFILNPIAYNDTVIKLLDCITEFYRRHDRKGVADALRPSGAPNAVDVIFRM